MNDKMKFSIDRKNWNSGNGMFSSLYSKRRGFDALGFCLLEHGISQESMKNIDGPFHLKETLTEIKDKTLNFIPQWMFNMSGLVNNIMETNDNISVSSREIRLINLFQRVNVELTFMN